MILILYFSENITNVHLTYILLSTILYLFFLFIIFTSLIVKTNNLVQVHLHTIKSRIYYV